MIVNATSESKPQVIGEWYAYEPSHSDWYSGVRLVAWISQNVSNGETTLYTKWQRNQYNYWIYWNESHEYVAGQNKDNFSLPSVQTNGAYDLTKAKKATFSGTSTTLAVSGYIKWDLAQFTENISLTFPEITIVDPEDPDSPQEEPTPPTPLEFDNIPYYYVYADDELVYGAGIEGEYIMNPKTVLEVNKAGSFKFDIPVGSDMYNKINKLKTTIEARQGNEILFRGRLLNTSRSINNTVSCYCEGFLSWLVDIVFLPETFKGQARDALKRYLERYNSRASDNRKIAYKYSDISANISIDRKDHSNAWDEIKSVLIDGVGGYIVPYLTSSETGIQWLSSYGTTTAQVIRFGENLLDFEEYVDASEVFTAVRPYGKEDEHGNRLGLTGSSFVINQNAIDMFGRIERTVFFDEIEDESALRRSAEKYLRTGLQTAMTMNIKAFDLHLLNVDVERIRLGDSVRVVSVPHQLDAYFMCTKIEIDMAHPQNTVYTFGATQRTISELTNAKYNKYVITEGA